MKFLFIILVLVSFNSFADLDDYKFTCEQIGFKVQSEDFGECVLELRKKDKVKQKANDTARKKANDTAKKKANDNARKAAQQRANDAQRQRTNDAQRQRTNDAQRQRANDAQRQQAIAQANAHFAKIQAQNASIQRQYQAEVAAYRKDLADARKQAADEKRRDRGLKLLELGLGIASGKYEGRGSNSAYSSRSLPPPPSINPYSRYRLTFPDNSYMDCDYNSRTRNADCF